MAQSRARKLVFEVHITWRLQRITHFSHWVIQKQLCYSFKKQQKNSRLHSKELHQPYIRHSISIQLCPLKFHLQGENVHQIHSSSKTRKCLLSALNLQGRILRTVMPRTSTVTEIFFAISISKSQKGCRESRGSCKEVGAREQESGEGVSLTEELQ